MDFDPTQTVTQYANAVHNALAQIRKAVEDKKCETINKEVLRHNSKAETCEDQIRTFEEQFNEARAALSKSYDSSGKDAAAAFEERLQPSQVPFKKTMHALLMASYDLATQMKVAIADTTPGQSQSLRPPDPSLITRIRRAVSRHQLEHIEACLFKMNDQIKALWEFTKAMDVPSGAPGDERWLWANIWSETTSNAKAWSDLILDKWSCKCDDGTHTSSMCLTDRITTSKEKNSPLKRVDFVLSDGSRKRKATFEFTKQESAKAIRYEVKKTQICRFLKDIPQSGPIDAVEFDMVVPGEVNALNRSSYSTWRRVNSPSGVLHGRLLSLAEKKFDKLTEQSLMVSTLATLASSVAQFASTDWFGYFWNTSNVFFAELDQPPVISNTTPLIQHPDPKDEGHTRLDYVSKYNRPGPANAAMLGLACVMTDILTDRRLSADAEGQKIMDDWMHVPIKARTTLELFLESPHRTKVSLKPEARGAIDYCMACLDSPTTLQDKKSAQEFFNRVLRPLLFKI